MTAREKFNKGDKVITTEKWSGAFRCGVVTGFGRADDSVLVRIGNNKTSASWNMTFWKKRNPLPEVGGSLNDLVAKPTTSSNL